MNLEPDVLGKYVESALGAALARLDETLARAAPVVRESTKN